jgi:hypothetical protein
LTGSEIGTLAVASASLPLAVFSIVLAARSLNESRRQGDVAERAVFDAQQTAQSAAVIHFTNRFFDLMGNGAKFEDADWAYQYWSLHATEFYFFDKNWLPLFMYELWMVELVSTYRTHPLSKSSHQRHVARYALNYPEMASFFNELARISEREFRDDKARHEAITCYIVAWKDHR